MRILIISYHFAPQNVIGAIRPTKLAKYLSRQGHEVTVLCGKGFSEVEDPILLNDSKEVAYVHTIEEVNLIRMYQKKGQQFKSVTMPADGEKSTKKSMKLKCIDKAYRVLRAMSDRSFERKACNLVRTLQPFDWVFSSYGPLSVHRIAKYAKEKGIAAHWIADFRDEVSTALTGSEEKKQKYLREVAKYSDKMTAVSHGVMASLAGESTWIPNGFDIEDTKHVVLTENLTYPPYRFVHAGQFAGSENALKPIFEAFAWLCENNKVKKEELLFEYAGRAFPIFQSFAKRYGFEGNLYNHGLLTRDNSLRLQLESTALLAVSKNNESAKGILTGKMLEYLMANKPIICSVEGKLSGSETKRLLSTTGRGFCYEEACAKEDFPLLCDYLRKVMECSKNGVAFWEGKTDDEVAGFRYENLAKKLESLMKA